MKPEDLEIVEEYELLGEKRYRLRVKGTNIVINVAASTPEEAVKKALQVAERVQLDTFLEKLKKQQG
ncbi:MAG: hypothetical protein GXO09_03480 [Crenarchaeota archaeon]|nr:hypothetical protein [Thermoproteota archaeon]